MDFEDMGSSWTGIGDAVVAGTLRSNDRGRLRSPAVGIS